MRKILAANFQFTTLTGLLLLFFAKAPDDLQDRHGESDMGTRTRSKGKKLTSSALTESEASERRLIPDHSTENV